MRLGAHLQRLHLARSSVRVEWACDGAVSTARTGGCGGSKRAQRGILKPQLGAVMLWEGGRAHWLIEGRGRPASMISCRRKEGGGRVHRDGLQWLFKGAGASAPAGVSRCSWTRQPNAHGQNRIWSTCVGERGLVVAGGAAWGGHNIALQVLSLHCVAS